MGHTKSIGFNLDPINDRLTKAIITVPAKYVGNLHQELINGLQQTAAIPGFSQKNAPRAYLEQHFNIPLHHHIEEFLLKFFAVPSLYDGVVEHKIPLAGEPRLDGITFDPSSDATFRFDLSLYDAIEMHKWKTLPFKAPARKKYKDIDRQVEAFIKTERDLYEHQHHDEIEVGDWVNFSIQPLNGDHQPLFDSHSEHLWLKLGLEEADLPYAKLFCGKRPGDSFFAFDSCLQSIFAEQVPSRLVFLIVVHHMVKGSYFCMDQFKFHFKLKTNKDVQRRLIEVYSTRDDFSLRRSLVEEALKLLIQKHRFEAPSYLVLRQQKRVLELVAQNPDYQVFKTHPNFADHVKKLAEKQAKEMLIVDQIARAEHIHVGPEDIVAYINLTKRARTKN